MNNLDLILERFKFHPALDQRTQDTHTQVRELIRDTAKQLYVLLGESREASLAYTHLQEAMMWANAHVAYAHIKKEDT